MGSSNINKTRMLIVTVIVGSVLLSLIKLIYPRIDPSQTASLVIVVSIISGFIIEKLIGNKKGKKDDKNKDDQ